MRLRRSGLVVPVLALGLIGLAAPTPAGATVPVSRPADPVVLTGAAVPSLIGRVPSRIVALRWTGSAWQRRHVQVDERAVVNFARIYGILNAPTTAFYGSQPGLVNETVYTSGATWTGNDVDRTVDADDEIVFMARDGGLRATGAAQPPGTAIGSGVEVRITDPLVADSESYLYLFERATTGILPGGAGPRYASYAFRLISGSYKTTYSRFAGPNPEDTRFRGATYQRHFADRWLSDQITIVTNKVLSADLLDRQKVLFAPNTCVRSETTFNETTGYGTAEGAFIINKNGPVRAIRSYVGANSGPNTQRTHLMYDRREEIVTDLRVHSIPSVMDLFDYSTAAHGMTYRNSLNQTGVTLDGSPDTLVNGEATWEQLSGAPGTITHVHDLTTSFPRTVSTYHLDDSTPADPQCTGDSTAATTGPNITSSIPCTDPALACSATLRGRRTIFYEAPGGDAATAAAHRASVTSPVVASADPWSP
ncbi:MAG: hypothetical protein RL531_1908 [Actinomycetota bacterium]|jgi:hypothetical protein